MHLLQLRQGRGVGGGGAGFKIKGHTKKLSFSENFYFLKWLFVVWLSKIINISARVQNVRAYGCVFVLVSLLPV